MSHPPDDSQSDPAQVARRLLGIIGQTLAEVHPQAMKQGRIGLHSALDRDLGLDSLTRVELWSRIEREFDVRLPQSLFAEAQTPGDILAALLRNLPQLGAADELPAAFDEHWPPMADERRPPEQAQTLIEVLDWHLQVHPERIHVRLLGEDERCEDISYAALHAGASAVAAGLQRRGLRVGERVALMLPTGRDFLCGMFGIFLAGGVPVPIYPPMRLAQIEEHLQRQAGILGNAEAVVLITLEQARLFARLLKPQVPSLNAIVTVAELSANPADLVVPPRQAEDIAFLQYTSGSTGQPKGVIVSHANLLTNLRAMRQVLEVSAKDVFVSWLPMYHDMGLIGAWFGSLYVGFPLVLMSPLAFLARPASWLWAIHRYRGSISAAPNFAYELCLSKVDAAALEGLDLSSWRLALNGAEPVNPDTLRRFAERFAAYGLAATALMPVYGLAEGTLGVAFPPLGRGPRVDRVRRDAFQRSGQALPAAPAADDVLRFVCSGRPLPGHQVRIVDGSDVELPERTEGHLQFKGPSTTRGYFRNPQEGRRVRHGDWFDSLDLAYLADGELYISGRVKDLIIRGGRNIYPYDLEVAIGNLAGLRKGCVAVFGSSGADGASERLVVLAETHERDEGVRQRLRETIARVALAVGGVQPDDIVLAAPHSVLKTSSGKIRRAASRELYQRGELGQAGRAVWQQLLHLALGAARGQFGRAARRLRALLYAGYFWALLLPIAGLTWLAVALLPRRDWCRRVARLAARLFLRAVGMPVRAEGLEWLQGTQVRVLIANHASYLDGLVLCAVLPPSFGFVAKRELAEQFIAGRFLRKLGACFVERFDPQRSSEDAERLAAVLQGGQSLVFFPEGTLTREAGLLPFRLGAFALASRVAVPLLPVALGGTRTALRGGQWFPRRSVLRVSVCAPLHAQGNDWRAIVALRDQARGLLLEQLEEAERLLLAG
ncbi:AMP-binding protein [Pseudomonas zhanjiangensis]|uniref:AMP-binding protein n=1 Tax=Pseudomonas zhanjiangensis TaxID=3239015 RepID=A0ABV3YV69_9PSED